MLAATGGTLALAALPVAAWLDSAGWTISPTVVSWATFTGALSVMRGLLVVCLLATESDERALGSFTTVFAVRRPELILWAMLAFLSALVMRAGDLANSHRFASEGIDMVRSWDIVLMGGVISLQMIAMATPGAIRRARRGRALRAEHLRALRHFGGPTGLA
jgi:hypothetical protein